MTTINSSHDNLRFLILDPTRGWQRFPAQHVVPMLNGAYRVLEFAGFSTRFVTAYLHQTETGRLTLRRHECSELAFDANGLLDQSTLLTGMLQRIESADQPVERLSEAGSPGLSTLTAEEIGEICELLEADHL